MPFLELFDETLDINSTGHYELSVQLSADRLSFCILDTLRNKYIMLRSFTPDSYKNFQPDQLEDIMRKDDFLARKYRNVHLLLPSARYTLIPPALYDPAKKEEYFSFNHAHSENSVILTNRLSDPDSWLLFGITRQYHEIVNNFFPGAVPAHYLKTLFHQISQSGRRHEGRCLNAHIEADHFSLVIFENNALKFCNAFVYRNISDILYHVLNIFRNLGIGQNETLVLSGETERFDDLYSNLSMYIRNVTFAGLAGNHTFSYVFNDTEHHRFLNLFTLAGCVS